MHERCRDDLPARHCLTGAVIPAQAGIHVSIGVAHGPEIDPSLRWGRMDYEAAVWSALSAAATAASTSAAA
ncbi:hypothetical protein SPHINGO361_80056 [Sphingomonas sp. EC-HK361]|nr:hypothetical protein SPHINGO361_80056 [Sphingomonas sp. EC-HK361]